MNHTQHMHVPERANNQFCQC